MINLVLWLLLICPAIAQVGPIPVGPALFMPQPVSASVTVDATGTELHSASGASFNYTGITVGSGSHRGLVVTICWDENAFTPATRSVTWDNGGTNQSMTELAFLVGGSAVPCGVYGLAAPTSGNKTLAVSWTGGNSPTFTGAVSFTNVNQTGGATSFPNAACASGALTQTISSSTSDIVVQEGGSVGALGGSVTGTQVWTDSATGVTINAFQQYQTGAASTSIGRTAGTVSTLCATDVKAG